MTTTSSVTGNSTAALTNLTGGSGTVSDATAAQDRFLKLLVAQLNNQDPMNPMDNAQMTSQMAQINTVTGINKLNETIRRTLATPETRQQFERAMIDPVAADSAQNLDRYLKADYKTWGSVIQKGNIHLE